MVGFVDLEYTWPDWVPVKADSIPSAFSYSYATVWYTGILRDPWGSLSGYLVCKVFVLNFIILPANYNSYSISRLNICNFCMQQIGDETYRVQIEVIIII
jgi:hypothetical protein